MKFDHSDSQSTRIDKDAYCDQPCARCYGLEEEYCIILCNSPMVKYDYCPVVKKKIASPC